MIEPPWVPEGLRWEYVLHIPLRVVKGNGAVSRYNHKKVSPVSVLGSEREWTLQNVYGVGSPTIGPTSSVRLRMNMTLSQPISFTHLKDLDFPVFILAANRNDDPPLWRGTSRILSKTFKGFTFTMMHYVQNKKKKVKKSVLWDCVLNPQNYNF